MARTATEGLAPRTHAPRAQLAGAARNRAWMTVPTGSGPGSARACAHRARDTVRESAASGVPVLETVLDASTPGGGIVLQALRDLVGAEVDSMTMRRAGSSVFVTLRLTALPAARPVTAAGKDDGAARHPARAA